MEILDDQYADTPGSDGLQVTPEMKRNWLVTSKWAIFFAVLGFIGVGIFALTLIFILPMMKMMMNMAGQSELATLVDSAGIVAGLVMLLFLAIIFFIHFFHYRFAAGIQRAMRYDSQDAFESAWRNLRMHFRLFGIVIVLYLAFYVIVLMYVGSMAASQSEF